MSYVLKYFLDNVLTVADKILFFYNIYDACKNLSSRKKVFVQKYIFKTQKNDHVLEIRY
jgi:hypothetical protein